MLAQINFGRGQCKAEENILSVVQARVPRGEKAFPVGHGEGKQDDADRREDPEGGLKGSHQETDDSLHHPGTLEAWLRALPLCWCDPHEQT